MTFDEYQKESRKKALYPEVEILKKSKPFIYPVLGLVGEAGEVAEKFKKVLRNENGELNEKAREEIKKELGDVLWYLSQIATELNLSLDDVAESNIEKLASRLERGVINSSGDNR